jgi:transposase
MAFRRGSRDQARLFPPVIDDYVGPHDPVRAYDALVEAMGLEELGIDADPRRVGNSRYHPKAMLKLLVYGYSYGVRSSRKLERETHYNVSFIWLMGGLTPDHKTIAEFRRRNKGALKEVLKLCARMCVELDLVAGNTLFVDGSKIRANASIKNSWTESRCEEALRQIDGRIDRLLAQCEEADAAQHDERSWVRMKREVGDAQGLRVRVEEILRRLRRSGAKSLNTVDAQCTKVKDARGGGGAGYNAQIVVDEKQGLIVSSDVVAESNDLGQFSPQLDKANEVLGGRCERACGDAGYAAPRDLQKADEQGIRVFVPSARQARGEEAGEFHKSRFRYQATHDRYKCPQGHVLTYRSTNTVKGCRNYRIGEAALCRSCEHYGRCTSDSYGRSVQRFHHEQLREKFEAQYEEPEGRRLCALRREKAELPFGHIKGNLGVRAFLLRGLEGVRAEMSLLATCFNITRMIRLVGGPAELTRRLAARGHPTAART